MKVTEEKTSDGLKRTAADIWKKLKWKLFREFSEIFSAEDVRCMLCGRDIFDNETGLCDGCLGEVTFNGGKTCKRCGTPLSGLEEYCGNCNFGKVYFDKAYSAFVYERGIKTIIYSVKFGGRGSLCRPLSKYLVYVAHKNKLDFDLVCYVPMTKTAEKRRRYNQARLLAQNFCDILDKDCFSDALTKVKETERQEKLGRKQRLENLAGAYAADKSVKGKKVLVIDDVKTSGATLNECAKALKKAGAVQVVGLTVAVREETLQYESEVTE